MRYSPSQKGRHTNWTASCVVVRPDGSGSRGHRHGSGTLPCDPLLVTTSLSLPPALMLWNWLKSFCKLVPKILQDIGLWGTFPIKPSHSRTGAALLRAVRYSGAAYTTECGPLTLQTDSGDTGCGWTAGPKLRGRNRGPHSHLLPYVCRPREWVKKSIWLRSPLPQRLASIFIGWGGLMEPFSWSCSGSHIENTN